MIEIPEQPQTMVLVIWISIIQLFKNFQFSKTCLVHYFIIPDNFHCYITISTSLISSSYNITENSLTRESAHNISIIQSFSNSNSVITFGIVPIVCKSWIFIEVFSGNNCVWRLKWKIILKL